MNMNGSEVANRKETIIRLLESTKREGMTELLVWLDGDGFFESPASTRYHGAYPGGLAKHSLGVYERLAKCASEIVITPGSGAIMLPVTREALIIAGLLHDVCKIGAYIGDHAPYKWNRAQTKGHALLSLIRIAQYIKMEPIEEMMIKFHMGTYGTFEFDSYCSEYPIRGDKSKSKEERYGESLANAWYHNPIVKLMYFCDELDNLAQR